MCMAGTNVEIDDDLIAEAMRRLGVRTKKDAVDQALRRVVGPPLTRSGDQIARSAR